MKMASKFVEDIHVNLLNQLIEASGLECLLTPSESEKSEILEEEPEERVEEEEEKTSLEKEVEEEEPALVEEEVREEEPAIFPTPSLRRVLPDKIRQIEEHNRVHVLPKQFKTEIDPAAIPKIACVSHHRCIDILGELVGATSYKNSLAEFWFLDTLAHLLRRAQKDGLNRPTQAVLILWFCEWMKEMQHFDAADRQRMLKRFQDNMLSAARFIAENEHLPTPAEAGVCYESSEDMTTKSTVDLEHTGRKLSAQTPPGTTKEKSMHEVTFEKASYACSLRDLTRIIHYIFDLFSTDYQYNLVRSVFTFTPGYVLIDSPFQLQNPKRMYEPVKVTEKKEKAPKEKKEDKKGKKTEPVTVTLDFLALMELKAKEEKELEEQEERDRRDYNLRSHILPLNLAATEELFDKYWPPPTPEPEPEQEPEQPKKKGKGKK